MAHHKRWRWLKGAIREGVERNDALGLGQDPPRRPILLQEPPDVRETLNKLRRQIRDARAAGNFERVRELARSFVSTPGRFNFPSDAKKLEAFSGWLREAMDGGILEVELDDAGNVVRRAGWQQTFVDRAYAKGVSHADAQLRAAGAEVAPRFDDVQRTLQLPIHQEKLELLYSRNFRELKGVTDAAGQQMSRTLSEGLARGVNPRRTASILNGRVDAVGLHRSRVIARTETIRAHAEATLTRFEQSGVTEVTAKAELATAGDVRVCPFCVGLEGEVFPIEEARNVIPVHPQSYSLDSEVYTEDGWTPVREVEPGDHALSLNPEDFDLGWQHVVKTTERVVDAMAQFRSRNFDLRVSADHSMFCRRREREYTHARKWEFIDAEDVPRGTQFYRSSEWTGEDADTVEVAGEVYDAELFAEFMGWWLSEGSLGRRQVTVHQSAAAHPKEYDRIREVCRRMDRDGKVRTFAAEDRLAFMNPSLSDWLEQFGHAHEKWVPRQILELAPRLIRRFLDAYLQGDGHSRPGDKEWRGGGFREERVYDTTSRRMADTLGEALIKVGRRPSYSYLDHEGVETEHHNGTYRANHGIWRVRECYGQMSRMSPDTGVTREVQERQERVACLVLPEWHTLLVRRNGRVAWSGNCRCAWLPHLGDSQGATNVSRPDPDRVREFVRGNFPDWYRTATETRRTA